MADKRRPLITFQSVSKTFGENPLDYKSLVLKNVHLAIYPGEFVIVFGPSGSGKSSILNLMAGLEFASAGKIMVRNRNMAKMNSNELAEYHRLKMGMVFQSFNLIKSLRVWENVALPQAANGVKYKTRYRRAVHLLRLFNIGKYAKRRPSEISGGEQQRVAIARALINNPAFLLVDEPTGNLDSKAAKEVMEIFRGLNQHGNHTIVLVTHNPDYLDYASRILYVQDGTIVKEEHRDNSALNDTAPPLPAENFKHLADYKDKDAEDDDKPAAIDHDKESAYEQHERHSRQRPAEPPSLPPFPKEETPPSPEPKPEVTVTTQPHHVEPLDVPPPLPQIEESAT